MPLPFLMSSEDERNKMVRIEPIAKVKAVAAKADLRLVGIGQMDQKAQIHVDGFVTRDELFEMMRQGAIGEITGWAYDSKGRLLKAGTNMRLTSIPPEVPAQDHDDRRRGRCGQGAGDRGRAERAPDQRPDHGRGDRKGDFGALGRRATSALAPMSSSAKADDPVRRGLSGAKPTDDTAYWMPRFRGA